jgi:hypothetical protein
MVNMTFPASFPASDKAVSLPVFQVTLKCPVAKYLYNVLSQCNTERLFDTFGSCRRFVDRGQQVL